MDNKIKELLTRLSFFAEDGMGEDKLVDFAKQADALLLEVARKPNTQQPVAWRYIRRADGKVVHDTIEMVKWTDDQVSYVAKCFDVEVIPLYPAPPVPRDVLMAAMTEVCGWIDANDPWPDLNEIADRYASKVQPEPVNQQTLAALKRLLHKAYKQNWQDNYPSEVERAEAAIAAAEAAQPVCHTCKGRGVIGGHVGQTPESFDYVTEDCPDCQQPASAQPVAVPDEMKIIGLHPTEYSLGYEYGWNACRAAMLSAAQKGGAA